ncbi:hypothetical protein [Streptomyces asiaticus]|uniref:hypothetical protein n=1 Tax=Streptomyces asiaticus TaxID=114695 RepID=UPI00382255E7
MADIQLANQTHTQQPIGPVVWILMRGERDEGGDILGVFLDRDLARGEFVAEARTMHRPFRPLRIDDLHEDEDGAIRLQASSDWLSLKPHTVTTAVEIDS